MKHIHLVIILAFQSLVYVSSGEFSNSGENIGEDSSNISNFQAVNITEMTFTMIWDTVADVNYSIAVQLLPDPSSSGSAPPTYIPDAISPYFVTLTTTGEVIQPSTIYKSYLVATNVLGPSQQSGANYLSITTVPAPPSNVYALYPFGNDSDFTTQTDVLWYKPTGGDAIKDYIVEWYPSITNASFNSDTVPHQNGVYQYNYTVNGLIPGERCYISVTALSSTGQLGDASNITSHRTGPPQPTNVSLIRDPPLSNHVIVAWKMPLDPFLVASYNITLYMFDGMQSRDFVYFANQTNSTSYIIGWVAPGDIYSAIIQAFSPNDGSFFVSSTPSEVSNILEIEDNRPTNVSVTSSTTTSIDIEWEYPVDEPSYPIQGYVVAWSSAVNTTSTAVFNSIMMATLSRLTSNTYYNITVQLTTAVGVGIPSEPLIGATAPGPAVINATHSVEDPTTMIRIDWNKPNGGDAIEYYLVAWWLTYNIPVTNSTYVPHREGKVSYNYTFDGFIPGESYTMVVNAFNDGAYGLVAPVTLPTVPESVTELQLTQNRINPTQILDLQWISPSGVSDRIEIVYYPLLIENATYKEVNSTVTSASLDVEPGTNYTVVVSVYSKNISSVNVIQRINSKPSEPQYNVTSSRFQLKLTWTQPSGHVDGFLIQSDPLGVFPNITLNGSAEVYSIQDLTPNTYYKIRMYSWITNTDGNIELSTSTPTAYTTLPDTTFCPTSIVLHHVNGVDAYATFSDTVSGYSNMSLETCPENTTNTGIPLGTRACSLNGEWQPATFLTSCDRNIQELMMENITTEEQRVNVTTELVVLTSNPETLEPSDIQDATDVLEVVVEADSLEPNTSALVVETVGNLLAVPAEELAASGASTRLLSILDDVALKVNLNEGEQFQSTTNTLAMSVLSLSQKESQNGIGFIVEENPFINELGFSSDQFNVILGRNEVNAASSIYLPSEAINKSTDGRISFYSFVNDNIFLATSSLQVSSDLNLPPPTDSVVSSQIVLAATVVNPTVLIENLKDLIEIHLKLNREMASSFNETPGATVCAFWDEMNAYWSTRGCVTIASNTSVQCQCDHLTNFASLFAFGDSTAIREDNILDILTYIGSSISLLAIVCTILSLLCVWNARKLSMQKATKVFMLNLSLALLFLNVFLLVSELHVVKSNDTTCLAVAIIIHFSLFSSLAWMMVEAIYLFIAITKPIYFRTKLSEKKLFSYSILWGWGFPALFITLVAAIKSEWYIGNNDICWIDSDVIVYLVIIPAALILLCNLICYIVVVVTFVKHKKPGEKSSENKTKREIMFSLTLFVTFGLTWIFGFLLFSSGVINIIFAYIFTIFNALQGVFLFILLIYRNKNIRETVSQEMFNLSRRFVGDGGDDQYEVTSLNKPQANNSKTGKTSISVSVTT